MRGKTVRGAGRGLLLWAVLCVPLLLAPPLPAWPGPVGGWARASAVLAGAVFLAVAVLARRRAPLAVALAVLAAGSFNVEEGWATTELWWVAEPVKLGPLNGFTLAAVVLGYRVGRRTARVRTAASAYAVAAGAVAAVTAAVSLGPAPVPAAAFWSSVLSGVLLWAVLPWSAGLVVRQRAEAHAREQELVAAQAGLRERNRIAQDMHDSIGHDLALIALRAAALEMAPDLDERHRRAAGELRAAAADTTERLRRVIGVLREGEPAPLDPIEGSLAEIVDRARDSGLRVELRGAGELRDRTAGRVVQEALTNAAKHAPGAPVTVEALDGPGGITVTVSNPPAAVPPPRSGGGGLGLMGLRERVRLAGGTLEAAPRAGGFRVVASFPRDLRENGAT
ncbi:sensor histidine kinase [Planomonospora venezuelensis]|uniref:histidine kinase n=1 Tax=Planomonospora venezuelensis TaxID=1999 RepID=A0A841DAL2_PLAVE|nr:sensor histidine kinase [Planomonospora venezuelensis]MBB5965737.1 signal transduction histidine kinase [Planomonospora venezuelensis]GIN05832.1 hypothetical protein Pve01_74900 [Planomonospora venezuelensis]